MGQEELVLRIPDGGSAANSAASSVASGKSVVGSGKQQPAKAAAASKSHSRESSGASVKFVNSPHHAASGAAAPGRVFHARNASKGSNESHVVILSPSSEPVTLSDRLSSQGELEDDDEDNFEEDDALLMPSDDLEDSDNTNDDIMMIDEDSARLADDPKAVRNNNSLSKTPAESARRNSDTKAEKGDDKTSKSAKRRERMLPSSNSGDDKSQNSDYGSFCNTPSENFGVTPTLNKRVHAHKRGGVGAEGDTTGDNSNDSVMNNEAYSHQPLLNPGAGGTGEGPSSGGGASADPPTHDSCSSDDEAGRANTSGYVRRKSRHPKPTAVRIETDDEVDATDAEMEREIPSEKRKTLFAFLFLVAAWVATTTSLALTHERVPEDTPLPDVFLDNVQYQSWGLDASEIIIMVGTFMAFVLALFHKHRFVVLRRIFFMGGVHYFYRALTFFITVLPKADPHYKCAPKLDNITFVEIARRVLKLLSGMGLSINGQHIYCGDYIYSGHTMTLLMTCLIIREYSPKRWFLLRWFSLFLTVAGVATLLFARGHYSIDVVIAYWITTRVWWMYHTMANNPELIHKDNPHNYLRNLWWWYIFSYLEGGVGKPLPKGFSWPLPGRFAAMPGQAWARVRGATRRRQAGEENLSSAAQDVETGPAPSTS